MLTFWKSLSGSVSKSYYIFVLGEVVTDFTSTKFDDVLIPKEKKIC